MKRCLMTIAISLWLAATVTADKAGTESPFAFGAGARELSLGSSALATADPATAAFWNPARLGAADKYSLAGFYAQLYESDVTYQYLGAALPTLELGTFGIGIFRLGINDIERRTSSNLLLGTFDDSRLGLYLAYARSLGNYELGVAVSIEHQSLDQYSATSSPGLQVSIGRELATRLRWLPKVIAGVIGRNLLQPGLTLAEENYALPTALDLGVALTLKPVASWDHLAMLTLALHKVEAVSPSLAAGLEYTVQDILAIRAGVRESNLSCGAGVAYRGFSFDYALVDRDLGSLHLFTLTSHFGRSTTERLQERAMRRETEFNNLMSQRLVAQNRRGIEQLVKEARQSIENDDLPDAIERLDRALFMARGSGEDTTTIARLLVQSQRAHAALTTAHRLTALLDSARVQFANADYLGARYFAGLILTDLPDLSEAQQLYAQSEAALQESEAREALIEARLLTVDSLVNYGRIDRALPLIQSLAEFAPGDPAVGLTLKRVRFEHWRETANRAYARNDYPATRAALDTLDRLVPGHQWSRDMRRRLAEAPSTTPAPVAALPAPTAPARLSPEIAKEVEALYRGAQASFQQGELTRAIDLWERVDRIAPAYQSVREYLVNAYKFVGVELYGQNQREAAVEIWQKAARLEPDNEEVAGYIRRTQSEILKLKELSYDQ